MTGVFLAVVCNRCVPGRSLVCNSWLVSLGSGGGASGVGGGACASVGGASAEEEPVYGDEDSGTEEAIPGPRCPTSWTVQPASAQEKLVFRQQEKLRYEKPHRAFTYKLVGLLFVLFLYTLLTL